MSGAIGRVLSAAAMSAFTYTLNNERNWPERRLYDGSTPTGRMVKKPRPFKGSKAAKKASRRKKS